jgi:hypothetical protein
MSNKPTDDDAWALADKWAQRACRPDDKNEIPTYADAFFAGHASRDEEVATLREALESIALKCDDGSKRDLWRVINNDIAIARRALGKQ